MRCGAHGAKPERAARDARPSWAAERAPSQTRVPALATGLCRPGSAERGALCEAACRTFLSSCPWPGMLETPVPLPSLPPDLMKAVQTEKAFSVPSAASASSDMVASACGLGPRRSLARVRMRRARRGALRNAGTLKINCGQVRPHGKEANDLLRYHRHQICSLRPRKRARPRNFNRVFARRRRRAPGTPLCADRPWAMPSS